MTLRPEVVRERLAIVRRNLRVLETPARMPRDAFVRDLREQWAAAYGLQTTVQALLDAAAHVLSARFAEAPRDYGEIVPLLERNGLLDAAAAGKLAKLSGFRNILVHQYAEVDFGLVHDGLQRLGELADFAAALERWLVAQGL